MGTGNAARLVGLVGLALLSVLPALRLHASAEPAGAVQTDGGPHAPSRSRAEELLELLGLPQAAVAITKQLVASLRASNPKVPAEVWDRYSAQMSSRTAILRLYGPIYERHLGEDEIAQVIAFYRSPAGGHLLSVLPRMRSEYLSALNQRVVDALLDSNAEGAAADGQHELSSGDVQTDTIHALLMQSGAIDAARREMRAALGRARSITSADSVPASIWDGLEGQLTRSEVLLDLWVPVYRRFLSDADVAEVLTFYRSQPGRTLVRELPGIQEDCLKAASLEASRVTQIAVRKVMGPLPQWKLIHPGAAGVTGEARKD
jgi:hypothetical protein